MWYCMYQFKGVNMSRCGGIQCDLCENVVDDTFGGPGNSYKVDDTNMKLRSILYERGCMEDWIENHYNVIEHVCVRCWSDIDSDGLELVDNEIILDESKEK